MNQELKNRRRHENERFQKAAYQSLVVTNKYHFGDLNAEARGTGTVNAKKKRLKKFQAAEEQY